MAEEEKKTEAAPAVAPVQTTTGTKKVNWVLTLVLSILVGWLGVDRFVMGQV